MLRAQHGWRVTPGFAQLLLARHLAALCSARSAAARRGNTARGCPRAGGTGLYPLVSGDKQGPRAPARGWDRACSMPPHISGFQRSSERRFLPVFLTSGISFWGEKGWDELTLLLHPPVEQCLKYRFAFAQLHREQLRAEPCPGSRLLPTPSRLDFLESALESQN